MHHENMPESVEDGPAANAAEEQQAMQLRQLTRELARTEQRERM